MESERNIYDCHYKLSYRYYKGGDLLAMFHATGYPEKWDYIGTIRPPHAGRFSNGAMVEHFATIWQAERYMLAEIAKGLQPYHKPTDPAPEPSGDGVGVCHSYETGAPCYSTSAKSENRREVTTLINGNGQPYKVEVPTVEIHGFTNSGGLAHIEENTGLHFEEIHKDSVYRAQPQKWEQVAALLLTYNWLTRYYNCAHRENVLVLRADCNTPTAATLYYKQDGQEFVGIRGAY
jgi:hypothetical protein